MSKNTYSGNIPLRLTPELHEALTKRANSEHRSINNYMTMLIQNDVKKHEADQTTFEARQFIGQSVTLQPEQVENGFVELSGIFYRYITNDNAPVDLTKHYAVVGANGNVVTIAVVD